MTGAATLHPEWTNHIMDLKCWDMWVGTAVEHRHGAARKAVEEGGPVPGPPHLLMALMHSVCKIARALGTSWHLPSGWAVLSSTMP